MTHADGGGRRAARRARARFGLSRLTLHHETLLWTTVGINVAGSFLLGGFTTFSTFSVQVVLEVDAGRPARAVARVAASVLGGIAAAAAGYALGRTAR